MTQHSASTTGAGRDRHPVRTAAAVVGAVFVLTGIAGFIPGVTTNYDQMEFAGHESGALLIGLFQISILHNLVHLGFGIAGLLMSRTRSAARAYLIGGGVVYLLLWLYGLIFAEDTTAANFVPMNHEDNWLHLGLGLGMIAIGVLLSRDRNRAVTR